MSERAALTRWLRRALVLGTALLLLLVGLFALNGLVLAGRGHASVGTTQHAAAPAPGPELRVVAFNLAKLELHRGGLDFEDAAVVRARLHEVAALLRAHAPDIVCLSEAVRECALCPVDQVRELAEALGMHAWAFGECYNFGLPFFRIAGGNAVLSRWPITAAQNDEIPGRKPFWVTHGNRRTLRVRVPVLEEELWIASVHHDSFVPETNLAQVRDLLERTHGIPLLIAGDLNAEPGSSSIRLLQQSGRFAGHFDGPPTWPAREPQRRIDYVLAPASWRLVREELLPACVSDHRAVLAVFARR